MYPWVVEYKISIVRREKMKFGTVQWAIKVAIKGNVESR